MVYGRVTEGKMRYILKLCVPVMFIIVLTQHTLTVFVNYVSMRCWCHIDLLFCFLEYKMNL